MSSPYYMEAFKVTSSIQLKDIKFYERFSCFSQEFEEPLGHSDEIEDLSENLIVKIECSSRDPLKKQPSFDFEGNYYNLAYVYLTLLIEIYCFLHRHLMFQPATVHRYIPLGKNIV